MSAALSPPGRWLAPVVALAVVAGVFAVPELAVAAPGGSGPDPGVASTPVSPVGVRAAERFATDGNDWVPPVTVWPVGGSGVVPVEDGPAAAAGSPGGFGQRPGGLGVRARGAGSGSEPRTAGELRTSLAPEPDSVRVTVAGQELVRRAGMSGVIVALSRADGSREGGRVGFDIDYSGFRHAFGGDFGGRLRLVELPACVLSTPEVPACHTGWPVPEARNVATAGMVSADALLVPGDAAPADGDADADAAADADGGVAATADSGVFALSAGNSSSGGDFSKTSLSPAYAWSAGSQGGDFSTSVPLAVPAGVGGPVPDVRLTYASGSVDWRSSATNSQASWAGDGWDLHLGYIERSYRACSDDGRASGDLCWYSQNGKLLDAVSLVLNGRATKIVKDDGGSWRMVNDDGWRVTQRTDGANDTIWQEWWHLTSPDGTQYTFGKSRQAAQIVPVYGADAMEPCSGQIWENTGCYHVYRWNLESVQDPRGNTMNVFYTRTTGKYGANNNQTTRLYDVNAFPERVEYGTRTAGAGAAPGAGTVHPRRPLFGSGVFGGCAVGPVV